METKSLSDFRMDTPPRHGVGLALPIVEESARTRNPEVMTRTRRFIENETSGLMRKPGASFPPVGFNPIRMRPVFVEMKTKTTTTKAKAARKATSIKIPTSYFETIKPFTDAVGITVEQYIADLISSDVEEVQTRNLEGNYRLFNIADLMLSYTQTAAEEERLRAKLERVCLKVVKQRQRVSA